MSDGFFDERVARHYDADAVADGRYDEDVLGPTVDFLADLAGDGRALELAIGTGRVGLALHERGVDVAGIDLSRAMVAVLKAKPGGEAIPVTIGDMTTTEVDGPFRLVYLVYNTISNLLTQDAQVACFRNAARHLESGGYFVVEDTVPPLQRLPVGERYVPFDVRGPHVGVDEIDVVEQRLTSHHYWVTDDGQGRAWSSHHRYTWPAELDLMARLAGMRRHQLWADWTRQPFTAESDAHISVWTKEDAR